VLDIVLPTVRIDGDSQALDGAQRIAFVASYSATRSVSRSLARLVVELESAHYVVVVVRASEEEGTLIWPSDISTKAIVVRKKNFGYDFGSWATGLALFGSHLDAPFVLLANDSLVGPFASMKPMIDDFEASDFDVWGATNTTQFSVHLQSFLLGFKGGVLQDPPLQQFWKSLRQEKSKQLIIEKYEIGLSRLLYVEGYVAGPWLDSERVVAFGQNPTITGWQRLLELGFPFVKRELLTNPAIVENGHQVAPFVEAKFGLNPHEWL
jgi:lipopolysaccharide biosynthesis protein